MTNLASAIGGSGTLGISRPWCWQPGLLEPLLFLKERSEISFLASWPRGLLEPFDFGVAVVALGVGVALNSAVIGLSGRCSN